MLCLWGGYIRLFTSALTASLYRHIGHVLKPTDGWIKGLRFFLNPGVSGTCYQVYPQIKTSPDIQLQCSVRHVTKIMIKLMQQKHYKSYVACRKIIPFHLSTPGSFLATALLGLAIQISFPTPIQAASVTYVDYGPGDTYFEIKNGSMYQFGIGGGGIKIDGVPKRITSNIIKVGSVYYCRWEDYAEKQVKKFSATVAQWQCTSNGIQPKFSKRTESQENSKSNTAARSSVAPSFPGSGLRKPGVWIKKVYQPVLGTMRAGKNYFGQGIVELQIASRDLGTNEEIVRSFSINCGTRDWRFLDPDAAWFGGIQEMFGKFSYNSVGTWACNRYGFKY